MFQCDSTVEQFEEIPYEQNDILFEDKNITFHRNLEGCVRFINSKYQKFLTTSCEGNTKVVVFFKISFLNIEIDNFEGNAEPFSIAFRKTDYSGNGDEIEFCGRRDQTIPPEINSEFLYRIFTEGNFTLSETDTYMLK